MKHIKLFEDLVTMTDPTYANDVFKIRYRSIDDLSTKKAPDNIQKPKNDVLDGIEVGDVITGHGIDDEEEHTGSVVKIQQDEKGENIKIEIEEEGEIIELAPSSVKFSEDGNKGHKDAESEPADTGNTDYAFSNFDTFQPTTYENKRPKMNTMKSFKEMFENETVGNKQLPAWLEPIATECNGSIEDKFSQTSGNMVSCRGEFKTPEDAKAFMSKINSKRDIIAISSGPNRVMICLSDSLLIKIKQA